MTSPARKNLSTFLFAALLCAALPFCAAAKPVSFGNAKISRGFEAGNGAFRTTFLMNGVTKEKAAVSGDEFKVLFMDGKEVKAADMKATVRGETKDKSGAKTLTVDFIGADLKVTVRYTAKPGDSVMRKTLEVCNAGAAGLEVDKVTVEDFGSVPGARHGGLGQPVFFGNMFIALESPGAYSLAEKGGIDLHHFPGWKLAPGKCGSSYSEVAGVSAKGAIEAAFRDYVDTFRYTDRSFILYNSWFDVRSPMMSLEKFKRIARQFDRNLKPYGQKIEYFVVDDGYQLKDSIWETNKRVFPNDFGPLRDYLEKYGTKLGIWLPLTGFLLNPKWGATQGYETDEDPNNFRNYYCLAGPKYNAALKKRLKNLVEVQGAEYFKHDFNFFECYNPNTPYFQDKRHSFEANVNAQADLLDYLHSLNKKTYLNITSNMWLSPWWLKHADTVWVGSGDYGYTYAGASIEPRDWAILYTDAWLYRRLVEEGARYPMNAIMTHGIIDGTLNRLGGTEEGFKTWLDNVAIYMGRGLYMRELYITPELLDQRKWKFLADAARWAKSNDDAFARTDWVGGDPRKGEAYGFHHHGGGKDLIVLRNPNMDPATIKLPKIRAKRLQQIYPTLMFPKDISAMTLKGLDVVILRGVSDKDMSVPAPEGVEYEVAETSPGKTVYRVFSDKKPALTGGAKNAAATFTAPAGRRLALETAPGAPLCAAEGKSFVCSAKISVPDGTKAKFYAALYAKDIFMPSRIKINGKTVEGLKEGIGWRLFRIEVEAGEREMKVVVPLSAVQEIPFCETKFRFTMYLESDAGDPAGLLTVKHAKAAAKKDSYGAMPLRDPGHSRIVLGIPQDRQATLDFAALGAASQPPLTASDLAGITAAKLRLRVFGVSWRSGMTSILINNAAVGSLPVNEFPYVLWQDFSIDVPAQALKSIKLENKVVVTVMTGTEPFKFKGLALSVKFADGTWRNTDTAAGVQSAAGEWNFSEGETFKTRSKPAILKF